MLWKLSRSLNLWKNSKKIIVKSYLGKITNKLRSKERFSIFLIISIVTWLRLPKILTMSKITLKILRIMKLQFLREGFIGSISNHIFKTLKLVPKWHMLKGYILRKNLILFIKTTWRIITRKLYKKCKR